MQLKVYLSPVNISYRRHGERHLQQRGLTARWGRGWRNNDGQTNNNKLEDTAHRRLLLVARREDGK